MINIKINNEKIKEIKKIWCNWFFRNERIKEYVDILDVDAVYRKMIFEEDSDYIAWKNEYIFNTKAIKDWRWRDKICAYIFDDLSDEQYVINKYKKRIQKRTEDFLIANYERYRANIGLAKIISIMKIEVCPYCNRNFMENYAVMNNGKSKIYFKGDLDHHYSKDEIPALALSFYNLIPSCKVCNHEKLKSTKRTFYPYYDNEEKEYRFCIELYDENDENDIIYDRPIENIEKKRYDSTVWQGISDNFKIKLRGIEKLQLNECMKNSNEVFHLEKKYNHSKEYVKEIIRKKYMYPEVHKDALLKNFGEVFKNDKEILETFYSYLECREYLYNRPLSKLTKDVMMQMGILTEES